MGNRGMRMERVGLHAFPRNASTNVMSVELGLNSARSFIFFSFGALRFIFGLLFRFLHDRDVRINF